MILIDYRRYYELETTKSWAVLSFHKTIGEVDTWEQARAAEAYLIENAAEYFDVLDLRDVSAWRQEPHTRGTTLAVVAVGLCIAGGTLWFFFGGGADLHRLTGLSIASLTWCLFGVSCLALAGLLYSDVDTVRPIDWHTSVLIGVMRLFPLGIFVTLIVLTNQLATLRAMYADPKLPPWYLLQICLTLSVGVLAAAHYLLLAYDSMQLRQQSVG